MQSRNVSLTDVAEEFIVAAWRFREGRCRKQMPVGIGGEEIVDMLAIGENIHAVQIAVVRGVCETFKIDSRFLYELHTDFNMCAP